MKTTFIPIIFILIFLSACKESKVERNETVSLSTGRFIDPPIAQADIPFDEYKMDAGKGDTLYHKSGSILLFPANSLVDKNGKIIEGIVDIKYREFRTPIDFYLSGIPMNYDSAGVSYTFESSGMFEILAYKDNKPVFVNPNSKPEVIMSGEDQSTDHRIYYLDTVQKIWVDKGLSVVTDIGRSSHQMSNNSEVETKLLPEVIKPELAQSNRPIIKIKIDTTSFEELKVYDNLKFQVADGETSFDPSDAGELWNNVVLKKQKQKGEYIVTFINTKRTVSYNVTPVFEGEDYKKALAVYERKLQTSERLKDERFSKAKKQAAKMIKDSIANLAIIEENKRIEKMNRLIEARNRDIEWQNRIIEKENDKLKKEKERELEVRKMTQFVRSIPVTQLGIWNSDKPLIILDLISLEASFVDTLGRSLEVKDIAVVTRSFNVLLRSVSNVIRVDKKADNMIFGISNGRIVYLTFTEYRAIGITGNTKRQVFKMKILSDGDNNYGYIQSLISQ